MLQVMWMQGKGCSGTCMFFIVAIWLPGNGSVILWVLLYWSSGARDWIHWNSGYLLLSHLNENA